MSWKKRLTGALCAVALLTAAPLSGAASLTNPALSSAASFGLRYETRYDIASLLESRIDSKIAAGCALNEEEAALRLYYLGMITGTGVNVNGGVEFALTRGLSRLEAAVFAVRLMGAEAEAEKAAYRHPYEDVPEWASAYVGYMYNRGLLSYIGGREYSPNAAVTCDEFMSYVLYALGYRMNESDYTLITAAALAREAGICTTAEDEALTRGGACAAMYNALRATMKNSERVLSDKLVESGAIAYQDAVFLLWSEDKNETEEFMSAVGYGIQWIIPDGYYEITSVESGKNLNVAATGANRDYEGVGVTLWESTDDVTQSFRLERTERGTYLIYSAASKSGFGRVVGTDNLYGGSAGLYQATSARATEYVIEGSVDGTWTILAASDEDMALSCSDSSANGAKVSMQRLGSTGGQTWNITKHGVMNASGEDMAIFCCNSLVVTQGAFDDYSHQTQNALDVQPTEGKAFAPFNGTIVRIDVGEKSCNAVWLESVSKVRYADGTYDYMTVCFMHDNDVSDLYVGMGLKQGDWFYDSGTAGNSSGAHIHVAVYRGKYNNSMRLGSGDVYAEDAFFLLDDVYIRFDYGLDWKVVSSAE